jgi:hypothetical protein
LGEKEKDGDGRRGKSQRLSRVFDGRRVGGCSCMVGWVFQELLEREKVLDGRTLSQTNPILFPRLAFIEESGREKEREDWRGGPHI